MTRSSHVRNSFHGRHVARVPSLAMDKRMSPVLSPGNVDTRMAAVLCEVRGRPSGGADHRVLEESVEDGAAVRGPS